MALRRLDSAADLSDPPSALDVMEVDIKDWTTSMTHASSRQTTSRSIIPDDVSMANAQHMDDLVDLTLPANSKIEDLSNEVSSTVCAVSSSHTNLARSCTKLWLTYRMTLILPT